MQTRKNPVQGTHSVRSVLPVKRSLVDAVLGPPQPLRRKGAVPPQAGAAAGKKGQKRKYPDEVILEIRRLREVEKLYVKDIVKSLAAKGIDVSVDYAGRCIEYATGGGLVPDPNHGPYI